MKKIYLMLMSIFTLCSFSSYSQTETDTTFFTQMNYIFANLDKSKVPNGILRDFAMEFTNLENYNGTAALADSNYADAQAFWDVYQTLLTGRVNTSASGFVSPAIADSLWYIQRDTGLIVLSGLYFNYSRFKDNAANNYVTITNGRLYDKYVSGVWQNPYQGEQAFLLSPPINSYSDLNLQVVLPSNLWFTNNGSAVTGLQIDADDGLGYRTLTAGVPLNISYADTGHKEWKYKLTITGGATLYSHSDMYIQTEYSAAGSGQYRMMSPQGVEDFPVFSFAATKSYLSIAGKGYATIKYANPDHIIRKPLIVVEGYDPGHILKPEEKFGYTNITNFLDDATDDIGSQLTPLLSGSTQQYDIIYVDWRNGTDYLQRNAYLLETIIQWVNANKQAVGGVMQPNVVLGQSMGGVIARYALKDMENNSINHQTRLYISDDAPQLGANVPQGYQHLARHARSLYVKTGVTATIVETIQFIRNGVSPLQALSLADQPASKQMLVNFVNGSNTIDNTVHAAWQTELKNMGYPNGVTGIPFRKVAISNGSECANTQAFGAGDNLLTYNGKANTRILGDLAGMAGLPIAGAFLGQPPLLLGIIPGRNDFNFDFAVNAKADGISNQVYKGKITYTKKILWLISVNATITNKSYSSNASTLPYDYFPGGYYYTGVDLSSSAYHNVLIKYNITASNQETFNFVPTASALDIGSGNVTLTKADYLARYIGSTPPSSPKNTPFNNFITAFNNDRINEQHISFERRNGDWMAAELNGAPQSADCSAFCDLSISGNNYLCTPSVYSVPVTVGGSTTVSWSASPSNLIQFSCQNCSQTTIIKIAPGTVTLTANITTPCGSFIVSKQVIIDKPTISGTYTDHSGQHFLQYWSGSSSSYNTVCNNYDAQTNMNIQGANSVTWSKVTSSPTSISWNQNGSNIGFYFWQVNQTAVFQVDASNGCGTTTNTFGFKSIDCSGDGGGCDVYQLSPNPAISSINITIIPNIIAPCDPPPLEQVAPTEQNSKLSSTRSAKARSILSISIYDNKGILQQQWQYSGGTKSATLNVSKLPSGVYFIRVADGVYFENHRVIIGK